MKHHPTKTERRLLVLRHAKSSWNEPELSDFQRPLNERGIAAAQLMGNKLRKENITVDIVLASTAARVRETLDLLLHEWRWDGPIVWEKQLYLASADTIMEQVAALAGEWQSVMVVGHNPGLSELVSHLSGRAIDMPTAALAILASEQADWPTALRHRPWHQVALWKPKELQ